MVVLVFMIAGMGIAITKDPPVLSLFYVMLSGAIGIIIYSAMKNRRSADREKQKRKFKK